MRTEDIDIQTRIGCVGAFVVCMVIIIGSYTTNGGKADGVFFLLLLGSVVFAIAWPIRGAVMKNKIRQQGKKNSTSPVLTALMLSMVKENTTLVHIPLPEDDTLIFVSDPSNSFFTVKIPQAVQNRVDQLIKPMLEQYVQVGWEVDTSEPSPKEPLYEAVGCLRMVVPFTKVRFRYTGVIVHLRRKRTQ